MTTLSVNAERLLGRLRELGQIGRDGDGRLIRLAGSDTVLGGKMVLDGEGAYLNSVAVLFIGAWGTTPVPINARCRYYLDPVVSFPLLGFVVTAPSWSVTMPMPSDAALLGVRAAFQVGYAGGMVPGGLMTTNAVFSRLGR